MPGSVILVLIQDRKDLEIVNFYRLFTQLNMSAFTVRLNFEVTALVVNYGFAGQVEQMLLADFDRSRQMLLSELKAKPKWFMAAARAAYLTAPIQ